MPLEAYLAALVERARSELAERLQAAWLLGSVAAGAYAPGESDVDVALVTSGRLAPGPARRLAARLSHRSLPCPARRLELVVYRRAVVERPRPPVRFELDLNSGRDGERLALDPSAVPAHWYLLDLAIGRELGRSLHGPAPRELIGAIPRRAQLEAALASLDWFEREEGGSAGAALAACRAWRYAEEGAWGTKPEARRWAEARGADMHDAAALLAAARAALSRARAA